MIEQLSNVTPEGFSATPSLLIVTPIVISEPVQFSTRIARMVSIKASHQLSERMSWSNMTLTVISGQGRIVMGEVIRNLSPNMTLEILPHCEHRIEAKTNLRMIVTFDAANVC